MIIEKSEHKKIKDAEYEIDTPVQQHEVKIGQGILPAVKFAVMIIAQYDLQPDDHDVDRRADEYKQLFTECRSHPQKYANPRIRSF